MSDETKTCTIRKQVPIDTVLEAEPPYYVTDPLRVHNSASRKGISFTEAKCLLIQEWISEFEEFLRDHRSQDAIALRVYTRKADICSNCGEEWEPDEWEGKTLCAYCGAELETESVAREGAGR